MSLADRWHYSSNPLLDFLFPAACPLCHQCNDCSRGSPIGFCRPCRERLLPRPLVLCQGCGAPLGPFLKPSSQCFHCQRDSFAFTRAWSLGAFDGELRLAVLKAKAKRGELVTTALADLLYESHKHEWLEEPPDVVIAVPHHWTDRLSTAHQASQTTALRLALRLRCRLDRRTVVKFARTVRQATLNPTSRRENLRDVFAVRSKAKLKGKRVFLVDDVLTTGTTAQRVASLLIREADARDVRVCVLARGIGQT